MNGVIKQEGKMNEIALVKNQVIEAEWAERIRQCRVTISEWCRQNSINPKTYLLPPQKNS